MTANTVQGTKNNWKDIRGNTFNGNTFAKTPRGISNFVN